MVPNFTLSFLDLIESELQRASNGLSSSHYLHNVRSGIANIVDLIQYDDEIADAADHLIRMAAGYINRHAAIVVAFHDDPNVAGAASRVRHAQRGGEFAGRHGEAHAVHSGGLGGGKIR